MERITWLTIVALYFYNIYFGRQNKLLYGFFALLTNF